MDEQNSVPAAVGTPSALNVDGVSYNYGAKQALENVSFTVEPGQFVALLGPNGAGKSTLFSLITRLFDTGVGSIEIAGKSLSKYGSRALAPLGVVFQAPTLDLDLSVKQNLYYFASLRGLSRKEADKRMMVALEALDMAERVNEKVRLLNGGHRRRVEIARSILHDPSLLLLDEPTVGLDSPTRRAIVSHIHDLAREKNIAVLWATHLFDEVEPTDNLLVLHQGRIIKAGNAGEIASSHGDGDLGRAFENLTGAKAEAEAVL